MATYMYANENVRVKKEDMYIMMALWMENSSWAASSGLKTHVVGAVFVLPNDRVLSVDCSRNDVHGAIQALVKYPDRVKDCNVYLSRIPCAICSKLLVQARVERVSYLPLEPEKMLTKENQQSYEEDLDVTLLFQASPVAFSLYVPDVGDALTAKLKSFPNQDPDKILAFKKTIFLNYFESLSTHETAAIRQPKWFIDKELRKKVTERMEKMIQFVWMTTSAQDSERLESSPYPFVNDKDINDQEAAKLMKETFNPKEALELSGMASMISNRTDDPKCGVGCVITTRAENRKEIVSIGWNGFPSKAGYAEFPRGSKTDPQIDKKYPFVIHAEQNAIFSRNTLDISCKEPTAYVNKPPCDECMPLLYEVGVKKVVLLLSKDESPLAFEDKMKAGEISVFKFFTCQD